MEKENRGGGVGGEQLANAGLAGKWPMELCVSVCVLMCVFGDALFCISFLFVTPCMFVEQVIGIFAGFGILLLLASPFLLLVAPCILCCKCKNCRCSDNDAAMATQAE